MTRAEGDAVCISGIGAVTPLGASFTDIAGALMHGESGIAGIGKFDVTSFRTKWAGIPAEGTRQIHWPHPEHSPRVGELFYAELAAKALLQECDPLAWYRGSRIGCFIGADEPAFDVQRWVEFRQSVTPALRDDRVFAGQLAGFFRASEFLDTDTAGILRVLRKHIAFEGAVRCHVGLCSASLQALGMALRAIRSGRVDAALCGGVSAKVAPVHIARLEGIGALCTDAKLAGPERSRPFDSRRSGFVPGEGAVLFLLERESAARRRGAKVYARILGYGSSMAAQHIVAPHTEDMEMTLCMAAALKDAGADPAGIDCVNAHGTSTRLNDFHEGRALSRLFADCAAPPVITATKSLHGHLIAAAGAMEVLCALASFAYGFIPAIRNLEDPEPAVEIPLATRRIDGPVKRILKNSFGMGGLAASLVLEAPDA